jgi:hypothetical protein
MLRRVCAACGLDYRTYAAAYKEAGGCLSGEAEYDTLYSWVYYMLCYSHTPPGFVFWERVSDGIDEHAADEDDALRRSYRLRLAERL